MNKEYRLANINFVDNGEENNEEMIVEGYAVVFDQLTDLGWCKEKIDRHAFDEADMQDCVLKYNHNDGFLILARTRNKSLELIVDEHGLKIRAKLIDTTSNRDVFKMIKSGLLDKMSFAFSMLEQTWNFEEDIRTVTKVSKLYDVSVVDVPAYQETEIYARSKKEYEELKKAYEEFVIEKEKLKLLLSL